MEIIKGTRWKFNIPFGCGAREGSLKESQPDRVIQERVGGTPEVESGDMVLGVLSNFAFKLWDI